MCRYVEHIELLFATVKCIYYSLVRTCFRQHSVTFLTEHKVRLSQGSRKVWEHRTFVRGLALQRKYLGSIHGDLTKRYGFFSVNLLSSLFEIGHFRTRFFDSGLMFYHNIRSTVAGREISIGV